MKLWICSTTCYCEGPLLVQDMKEYALHRQKAYGISPQMAWKESKIESGGEIDYSYLKFQILGLNLYLTYS